MSDLIDRLRKAGASNPEIRDILEAAANRLGMHARRARKKRTLLTALWAAHQDAMAIKRRLPGGKRRESESWWYFAPAEEVMREARRLLGLHDLLLMFTGEWITSAGLVRVEYELAFVPTGESRALCWETERAEEPEERMHGVTWAARDAQKNIALMALGIPLENDPEIQAREDEARHRSEGGSSEATSRRVAVQRHQRQIAELPRLIQRGRDHLPLRMDAAADLGREAAERDRKEPPTPKVAVHELGLEDETPIDYGGLTSPVLLPGELDEGRTPTLYEVAAAAVRWHSKTGQGWDALFLEIGHRGVPDRLSTRDLVALRDRLSAHGFWGAENTGHR